MGIGKFLKSSFLCSATPPPAHPNQENVCSRAGGVKLKASNKWDCTPM